MVTVRKCTPSSLENSKPVFDREGGVWVVDLHAIGVLCYRDARGMPQILTGSDVKIVDLKFRL